MLESQGAGRGVPNYGVLKGTALAARVFPPRDPARDQPHYHIRMRGGGRDYDVAVNVLSRDGSEVLYAVVERPPPPNAAALAALPPGARVIGPAGAHGIGLDFIREHLVQRSEMTLLPVPPHPDQGALHGALDDLVQRAVADPTAQLYAFGSGFSNPGQNPFWGFHPDVGAHDVHMNQGNPVHGSFAGDNGVYQDGALLVHFPAEDVWHELFIAFQTQSWTTDDHGNPVGG